MGKRLLNLYVEDSQIELAKAKNINLSALFREMMNTELGLNKSNEIQDLKLMNSKLQLEIIELKTKFEKEKKQWETQKPKRNLVFLRQG